MTRQNNFDLIRLAAALQVAVVHALTHFGLGSDAAFEVLVSFPGVPVFFFLSGFLVSDSYARAPSIRSYVRNRVLRLYPALWVATALSVLSVSLTGYLAAADVEWSHLALWVLAQASFVQFFSPDFMRGYGVGVLNGSLWTISVELQFYVLLPLATLLLRSRRAFGITLALFALGGAIYMELLLPLYGETFLGKLAHVSFLPWLWMFLLGLLAQAHWAHIRPLFEGKFRVWLSIYVAATLAAVLLQDSLGLVLNSNKSSILLFWPLTGLVLSAAFTRPRLTEGLLRGHDLSYGLYIYHMPVLNFWIFAGLPLSYGTAAACVLLSLGLALASWVLVERPALRLKGVHLPQRPARPARSPMA